RPRGGTGPRPRLDHGHPSRPRARQATAGRSRGSDRRNKAHRRSGGCRRPERGRPGRLASIGPLQRRHRRRPGVHTAGRGWPRPSGRILLYRPRGRGHRRPEAHPGRRMTAKSGLLIVDKPGGWTSHDVVARIRKLTGTKRVGHAGTLDPMATGVLVVGIEKATRLLGYLALTEKEYTGTIRLGQTTDTDDADGAVIE